MRQCWVCGSENDLQDHHVFFGPNRKQSEKYGFKVWLCYKCHIGNKGVHFNKRLDIRLKQHFQRKFERDHTREEFLQIIERNYLC
jgi:ribosomal protein L37AE/L43A